MKQFQSNLVVFGRMVKVIPLSYRRVQRTEKGFEAETCMSGWLILKVDATTGMDSRVRLLYSIPRRAPYEGGTMHVEHFEELKCKALGVNGTSHAIPVFAPFLRIPYMQPD